MLHNFYGIWSLDPASCDYDPLIPPPAAGVYTILARGDATWFHVRWTDQDGHVHHIAYESPSDGTPRASGDAVLTTRMEGEELVSIVERAGVQVHVARRRLVDGDLQIDQRILTDAGTQELKARYVRTSAKQVLLYRRDLKMRKGKIAAQCAHASMAVFFRRNTGDATELRVPLDGPMAAWVAGRFTKICLSVEDEESLTRAHDAARARGLPCAIITDAGKTEFGGVPTRTAVAIGPAAIPEIDAITGPGGLVDCKLA